MILPKDHITRNIISVYQYMKEGKNEQQRIKSFTIIPKEYKEQKYDVLKIEYEDGSTWTLTSDEFDTVVEKHKEEFDEEFLCLQHLVGMYFKGASAEFIDVFAKILKSYLNSDWHDEMPNMMMEAGYCKNKKGKRGGWQPDKVEKLLPAEVIRENKFLADGSDEWGCYTED